MKRIAFALVFALLFMGVVPPVASFLGRTSSELGLFLILNGERGRTVQADGGGLMLWTADGGMATITVSGGNVYYVENAGSVACHLCTSAAEGLTWDGGCNTTVSDPNYGWPIAVGGYRWISTRDTTTTFRAVPASGSTCSMPVAIMR